MLASKDSRDLLLEPSFIETVPQRATPKKPRPPLELSDGWGCSVQRYFGSSEHFPMRAPVLLNFDCSSREPSEDLLQVNDGADASLYRASGPVIKLSLSF